MTLPAHATIIDIAPHLSQPEGYVRRVLENLHKCRNDHKQDTILDDGLNLIDNVVQVRIGRMGKGSHPHYRIERGWEIDLFADEAKVYGIFHGASHKKFMQWDAAVRDEHWSTQPTPLEKVQELIGQLRAFRKSRR